MRELVSSLNQLTRFFEREEWKEHTYALEPERVYLNKYKEAVTYAPATFVNKYRLLLLRCSNHNQIAVPQGQRHRFVLSRLKASIKRLAQFLPLLPTRFHSLTRECEVLLSRRVTLDLSQHAYFSYYQLNLTVFSQLNHLLITHSHSQDESRRSPHSRAKDDACRTIGTATYWSSRASSASSL
jgi:hypothetical protein